MQFLKKGSSDFFGFNHFELREAQTLKPNMGLLESDKIFQGWGVFHQTYPFFLGGGRGARTDLRFNHDFSQISMTSVV